MILTFILPFVAILIVLIVIHELGHFITAKLTGVKVLEFGLGYPPRIWGFTFRNTIYSINWLPLGGFVRLVGEEDPSDPQSLAAKPRPVRLLVLASGSLMNFILPIFLFALAFMIPRDVNVGLVQIGSVVTDSPAQEAGLQSGDIVLAVNGEEVRNPQELSLQIRLNLGETVRYRIKRPDPQGGASNEILEVPVQARWTADDIVRTVKDGDTVSSVATSLGVPANSVREAAGIEYRLTEGQQLTVPTDGDEITYRVRDGDTVAAVARRLGVPQETILLAAGLPDPNELTPGEELRFSQGPTGITVGSLYPFTEKESFPPWEAIPKGWTSTINSLILARNEVISWFKGGGGPAVAGPVGIAQVTGEVVERSGWQTLLQFAALLSINLAIINILPLPMLDGGRIMFVLLEIARRGKRIAPEREALVHFVGLSLIITLAVVITYFDVLRIIRGESLFR
ncbi:MAG: site-2 protease family protein [Dehalococcoidia bacterium]